VTDTATFNTPHAQLFPPLASYELADLRADIEQNGIRVPIVVQAATMDVLDGHHGYRIAQDLGLALCEGVEYELVDTDWPLAWAIRYNLNRRNLGVDAEAVVRRERQRLAFEMSDAGMTQQEIASQLGVGRVTVTDWLNNDKLVGTFVGSDKSTKPKPGNRVKLPPKERPTVMARLADGETQQQVAADYKVSRETIAKLVAKAKAEQAEAEAR
jgi:ParB-like chromosome segregation protein Spo0J